MNDTVKTLISRRSCRRFRKEQLLETELAVVLEAGLNAPSGMNRQPAVLVVIQDEETIEKLSQMNAAVMGKTGSDPFYGAPTVVAVLADPAAPTWKEDGSLVIGNLLNAAYSMGIGGCWIHRAKQVFESEEGQALLEKWGVPKNFVGVGHCVLGYPEQEFSPLPRKQGRVYRV